MGKNYLAQNLKALRTLTGETSADLGKVINRTKSSISDYESGKTIPPSDTLSLIAKHYGVTIDILTNFDLSVIEKPDLTKEVFNKGIDAFLSIFPTFGIDEKTGNEHIDKAYSLIRAFQRSIHDSLSA